MGWRAGRRSPCARWQRGAIDGGWGLLATDAAMQRSYVHRHSSSAARFGARKRAIETSQQVSLQRHKRRGNLDSNTSTVRCIGSHRGHGEGCRWRPPTVLCAVAVLSAPGSLRFRGAWLLADTTVHAATLCAARLYGCSTSVLLTTAVLALCSRFRLRVRCGRVGTVRSWARR